jgi:hypothetical protein
VINDRFDEALEDLKSILGNRADRLRTDDPGCRRRVERVMA